MRRLERRISDSEALAILLTGEYGVLGTVSAANAPYCVPLSYCLLDGVIYFHCAVAGTKLDNIALNPQVSFCVVGGTELLPGQFATRYESCIAQGHAREVFGPEKKAALMELVRKYSKGYESEGERYIESLADKTRVYGITIDSLSGKARR